MTQKTETQPIYVTQPFLPPLEELVPYLEEIWKSRVLTNGGSFHRQLEKALCEHLGVEHLALFCNGTIALITALQSLRITGGGDHDAVLVRGDFPLAVVEQHQAVFVDIDPDTLNMDPSKIEAAITPQTTAIMPVHCYGHPCDAEAIQKIADNYNLKSSTTRRMRSACVTRAAAC